VYLSAWQVCYDDFLAIPDLDDEQKELKHYKIGFTHSDAEFVVLFQALLLPDLVDGVAQGTIRATFGRSMRYRVDRRTLSINERLYLK
jgi:hypothetical protein